MTDKDYQKHKRRIKKCWDKWFETLGLGWWQVDLHYDREADEDEAACIGKTTSRWQYRTADITFFMPRVAELDDDKLEEAVVHEMTHVLLAALHDFRDDSTREITEYTATTIARSIIWARQAGEGTLVTPRTDSVKKGG